MNADEVRAIADELARRGPAHVIGLLVYAYSLADYGYANVVRTLEPAFGREIADEVCSRIHESLKNFEMYWRVKVEGKEEHLKDYLTKYLLKRYLTRDARDEMTIKVVGECDKRYSKLLGGGDEVLADKRALSIACAVIQAFKDREDSSYPGFSVYTESMGFVRVSSSDMEWFSRVVSLVLELEKFDVRDLFCKYLLGFVHDWCSRKHCYYNLLVLSRDPHHRETRERGL